MDTLQNLWIITQHMHGDPRLDVWPLLRETEKTYVVKMRDGVKLFHKDVAGRRYFKDEEGVVAWLRRCWSIERTRAEGKLRRMTRLLAADDAITLAYAQDVDEVVMRIDYAPEGE